jgi:hypothetical protein
MWTLHSFARLVKELRTAQRAYGSGYRTPAGNAEARGLEVKVDAAIKWVEQNIFPVAPRDKTDGRP